MFEAHYYENNILSDARTLAMEDYYDDLTEATGAIVNLPDFHLLNTNFRVEE